MKFLHGGGERIKKGPTYILKQIRQQNTASPQVPGAQQSDIKSQNVYCNSQDLHPAHTFLHVDTDWQHKLYNHSWTP